MRIDKLIVRKTNPFEQVIREIKFIKKGLNLIVDDTPKNLIDSGNSVGKSTAIKIIDLCLGARSVKDLYYDADTKSENKIVKDFLKSYKVQAELILIDVKINKTYSIKRDLFPRGKKYISDYPYNEQDFQEKLKEIIFGSKEPRPTFRQLMPKFIRLIDTAEDNMIKFLPSITNSDTYETIYCFLFQIHNNSLLNKKSEITEQLSECQKAIQILEKSNSISSMSALQQSLELINSDLDHLYKERKELSYMDAYREELELKRSLTLHINNLQSQMNTLEFEVETINKSIKTLTKEKRKIDFDTLKAIYREAQSYIPNLQKNFENLVSFHNAMIENRIFFIQEQLNTKQQLLQQYHEELQNMLNEKEKIIVDVLDEGILDELNVLNRKIEDLSLRKGEIQQSIHLLDEQEEIRQNLNNQLSQIKLQMKSEKTEEKFTRFNQIFSDYCAKLYGEKYLLSYNPNWREEKKFPVSITSLGGNVGTGKKKAIIVAYDLAYMQYSIEAGIKAPLFVIHDKMENTYIHQLKTIFEICEEIDGQYIIPILRERIDRIDQKYIEKAKILELSSNNKFFRI